MEVEHFTKEGLALAAQNGKKKQSDRFNVPGWSFSSEPELIARKKQKQNEDKVQTIHIHHNGEIYQLKGDFILHSAWLKYFTETVEASAYTSEVEEADHTLVSFF